tara:strand:+ start:697 stop:894 length:198 start_codon:yes stop_codon:yes gene_type:complete
MTPRVIGVYDGEIEKLLKDVIKYDKIIETWTIRYPDSCAELTVEIDVNNFYTLILNAESNREDNR